MIKTWLKQGLSKLGLHLASTERLGLSVEHDLKRLTTEDPLRVVFDVGANVGQSALRFAAAFESAVLYSFEPVPASYSQLVAATAHEPRIKPFNLAMGAATGRVSMNVSQDSERSSLVKSASTIGEVEVPMSTVDATAREQDVASIDLLKIDVEGYELQVLAGAESVIKAGRVRYIYAECVLARDQDDPHSSFFDLHAVLESAGYCFVGYYAESFHLATGCALGNVLYALRSKLPTRVKGRTRNIW